MRTRVRDTIADILQNGWLENLRAPESPGKKLARLRELFPDFDSWVKPAQTQLLADLQRDHGIFFGVCDFLVQDDYRLYCRVTGINKECHCSIPKPSCCVFLDKRQPTPA